jgi:hypothetical protein
MKGVLPSLVRWLVAPVQEILVLPWLPPLAQYKIFFMYRSVPLCTLQFAVDF